MADDNKREISITFNESYVAEILDEYPAATRPSDAIRMAVQESVERKQQMVTPGTIRDSVIEAIERAGGGSVQSCQRIVIGDVDELDIENAGSVDVQNMGGGDE